MEQSVTSSDVDRANPVQDCGVATVGAAVPKRSQIVDVSPGHVQSIVAMNDLCGFPARSKAGWNWVLFENPEQGDHPSGFAFIRDGKFAAFAGTFRKLLYRGDEVKSMIIGHTLLSDLTSPGTGFKIARYASGNSQADFIATLNNNELSAKLYPKVKMLPWLGETGQCYAEYLLRPVAVATGAALRKAFKGDSRAQFDARPEYFVGSGHGLRDARLPAGFEGPDPANPSDAAVLDEFNQAMREGPYFQPDRGARVTGYRLSDPDAQAYSRVIVSRSAGQIEALLALSAAKDSKLSPPVLEIEDIALRPGSEGRLRACLQAAVEIGRQIRVAKIRLRYVRDIVPDQIAGIRGWKIRKRSYSPNHARECVQGALRDWGVSPASGDFFFALRRPPLR